MSESETSSPERKGGRRRTLAIGAAGVSVTWAIFRGLARHVPLVHLRDRLRPRPVLMTPPVEVVTHSYGDLNTEVTIVGVDGKGPVFSVVARVRALGVTGPTGAVAAQAIQRAFQDQFAARGDVVTEASTLAIIPALDDPLARYIYARVTRQHGRRNTV